MTSQEFKPQSEDASVIDKVSGRWTPIAGKQILSEGSTNELIEVLAAEGIKATIIRNPDGNIIGHPITDLGDLSKDTNGNWMQGQEGAATTKTAPHLLLEDGTILNAGLIADNWRVGKHPHNPGDTVDVALRDAKIEIEGEQKRQAEMRTAQQGQSQG